MQSMSVNRNILQSFRSTRRQSPSIPNETSLTIYSQTGHIVHNFIQGAETVKLPKSVDVASIIAINTVGEVVPFNYRPAIDIDSMSLLGQTQVTVTKGGVTIIGILLSLQSKSVTLLSEEQIVKVNKYDSVAIDTLDRSPLPSLTFGHNVPLTLSYIISNIGWSCTGTMLIDNDAGVMDLRLAGNVTNHVGDIEANVSLVSGNVHQHNDKRVHQEARMMRLASPSAEHVQISSLEDYTTYDVGKRHIQSTDIIELGVIASYVDKIYTCLTTSESVQFGYRFTASSYVPECSINAYSLTGESKIGHYIGSTNVNESQIGDDVEVMFGNSTKLQCKTVVSVTDTIVKDKGNTKHVTSKNSDSGSQEWRLITEQIETVITNHNIEQSTLILKHYIGNKTIVSTDCQGVTKDKHIEWHFQIAGATDGLHRETFSCQIQTTAQNY